MTKIPVGILGATGAVGQKLIALLLQHPWFQITELVASQKAQGKTYGEYVLWHEVIDLPESIRNLPVKTVNDTLTAPLLFSGLSADIAGEVEANYAACGHIVVSNSRNHRLVPNVPLVIPEVNAEHFALLSQQKWEKGGLIVTNPNCVVMAVALSLAPLVRQFGVEAAIIMTMQGISGAGYPGVPASDIVGNVIPYIADEEEKIAPELTKILGKYSDNQVVSASIQVSAHCNRVPVVDGHTINISVKLREKVEESALIAAFRNFAALDLPSAPREVLHYCEDKIRPQPRYDLMRGEGMTVTLGNLRPCAVLDWKFTILEHNTVRGAAGAAIINAEYLVANHLISGISR